MNATVAYKAAFREYEEAEQALRWMIQVLKEYVRFFELRTGTEPCFSATPGEPEPPLADLLPQTKLFDPDTFPTATALQDGTRRRFEARIALADIWSAMPTAEKIGLAPPPTQKVY